MKKGTRDNCSDFVIQWSAKKSWLQNGLCFLPRARVALLLRPAELRHRGSPGRLWLLLCFLALVSGVAPKVHSVEPPYARWARTYPAWWGGAIFAGSGQIYTLNPSASNIVQVVDSSGALKYELPNPGAWANAGGVDAEGNLYLTGNVTATNAFGSVAAQQFFLAKYGPDHQLLWVSMEGDTNLRGLYETTGSRLAFDQLGNAYVVGRCASNAPFGHWTLQGGPGPFFCKYSSQGMLQWARNIPQDSAQASANAVAVDGQGNLYLGGGFGGSADFGGTNLTAQAIRTDIFLAKYTTDGNLLWVQTIPCQGGGGASGLVLDSMGNCCLSGSDNYSEAGAFTFYVGKYSQDGSQLWLNSFSGGFAQDIAIGPENQLVVTGEIYGSTDFGSGPLYATNYMTDFLCAMDLQGNFKWLTTADGYNDPGGGTRGWNLAADQRNIYLKGDVYRSSIGTSSSAMYDSLRLPAPSQGPNPFLICFTTEPAISIARGPGAMTLSWPARASTNGFTLESSAPSSLQWLAVTNSSTFANRSQSVVLDTSTGSGLFRLRK
jgi:hypothetical protein